MASVSPVNGGTRAAYSTGNDNASTAASRTPQKTLGQSDFLKLLAVQFQKQDPMKPMEDANFIAQMAQFSALEQSTTLVRDMTALRADQQRATANSYLGQRVTFDTGDGKTASGDVTAVDVSGTEPKLVVGDKTFSLSAVLRVEPGRATAPAPISAGGV
jgi:flagellar basal-body rod modification protein FlgD